MAVYVADLRSTTGWTERFNTGNASTAVVSDAFRVTQSSNGSYGFSWDTIDGDADRDDVEVMAKVRHAAYASNAYAVGVFARGSVGVNCYAAVMRSITTGSSKAAMTLAVASDSTGVPIDSSLEATIGANNWCWIKLRVNGTTIQSRAWLDGTAEPGTWNCDVTDATHAGVGWVGIYTNSADCDPYDIGYFAVATNGDSLSTGASGGFFLGADF
jgi:hypothetical protein